MRYFGKLPGASGKLFADDLAYIASFDTLFVDMFWHHSELLPKQRRKAYLELVGLAPRPGINFGNSSHGHTRAMLSKALAVTVTRARASDPNMVFITLISDRWRTSARRPRLDLVEIKNQARGCLKQIGFRGIAYVEFDVLVVLRSDPNGDQILVGVHAVGYIDPVKAKMTVEELGRSKRLSGGEMGLPTVVVKSLSTGSDVTRTVAYCLKHPIVLKRFVPRKCNSNQSHLRTVRHRQQHLKGRLLQIYGHVPLTSLIMTVGGCKHWLREALEMLPQAKRREAWFTTREVDAIWNEIHERQGRRRYRRPKIRIR